MAPVEHREQQQAPAENGPAERGGRAHERKGGARDRRGGYLDAQMGAIDRRRAATTSAAVQGETQHRHQFERCEGPPTAVAAGSAGEGAFARGPADEDSRQEAADDRAEQRSEENTSELQSLM